MKYSQILDAAQVIVSNISSSPPARFAALVSCINHELDVLNISFDERRFVCAAIAQEANSRALGVALPASKILRKVASYAIDAHDEWAAAGFFLRGSARRATQEELDMRRTRENTIADYVEGAIAVVGAMRDVVSVNVNVAPATINAQIVVPAEAVKRRVEAKPAPAELQKPANDGVDATPAPAPAPAS